MYLPQLWSEARDRKVHGKNSEILLKYTDSLDSTQKQNVDRPDISPGLFFHVVSTKDKRCIYDS